jgi:two-component system LytT family sensor kinase
MGWDAGVWTGALGGLVPLRHGEWLAPVVGALIGAGAGLTRRLSGHPEAVRDFSPVPLGNLGHIWRRWKGERALDPRLLVIGVGTLAEVFRTEVARFTDGRWLFGFQSRDPATYCAVVLACLTCVGVSLKIWNTPRIEAHLRRQEALLAEARLEALRSQINPHFLFNTLNTVNALVRTHPEQARAVTVKLSALLRRMLYSRENTCTLREELDFVESYLAIEAMRFGEERLRVVLDVEAEALAAEVPCVLLQPLVENAIKHGIGPKARGGVITIGAHVQRAMLEISVRDNGVGMSPGAVNESLRRGIGLTNIRERLRSLYGAAYRLAVDSQEGVGTTVQIALPHRVPVPTASQDAAYTPADHT